MGQQEHHKKISFLDEYKNMLMRFGVPYDERYIFKLPEE
jgi:putative transposase